MKTKANTVRRWLAGWVLGCVMLAAAGASAAAPDRPGDGPVSSSAVRPADGLVYLDTGIENASPLWYEAQPDRSILIRLMYDRERSSPNRAAGHIHFRLEAPAGTRLTLQFTNLDNVWNGRPGSVANELGSLVVSEDGREWRAMATETLSGQRVCLNLVMPGPVLHVARVEPYRLTDLDRFLGTIRSDPRVAVEGVGRTVQGRELEVVRVGDPAAPRRVFLRARAHPWESGGNWVLEGLVRRLLRGDAEAERFLERYCVYFMPMANKDGVALGRTRFNLRGRDLNRNWDRPADAELSPENHALERWLERSIREGKAPHLAIELHNDGRGLLHLSRPPVPELARYLERMERFETLLRRHTWFTEGSTPGEFRNSGTLGDGWLERYRIDALVHEFSGQWIAGLKERPLGRHWKAYGEGLAVVLHEYFAEQAP